LKSQLPTDQTFLLNARIEKLREVIDRLEQSLQGAFYSNLEHTFYKLRLEETIQMNKKLLSKYEKELLAD
jgi:cell shape-determining protein MreC